MEDFLVNLGRFHWEYIISIAGIVITSIIGFGVNKNLTILTAKFNRRLAKETPTFVLRIEETREYIKLTHQFINELLWMYYRDPFNYFNYIGPSILEKTDTDNDGYLAIIDVLKKFNDFDYTAQKFTSHFTATSKYFYSLYVALIPDRFNGPRDLFADVYEKFSLKTPFIDPEIKRIGDEIKAFLFEAALSDELIGILDKMKTEDEKDYSGFLELRSYWNTKEILVNDSYCKMQEKFSNLWLNPAPELE